MFPFLWIPELFLASATGFSQQQLTVTEPQQSSHLVTNQLLFTSLNSTDFSSLTVLLITSWHGPLPSNCRCLIVSWSLPSNGSTCHIAPTLRLFVPNSLQAYRHFFFSEGCPCDVCDRPRFPFPWLGSHGDYSPTAPIAPFLKPFALSGSPIRCKLVQVYQHHFFRGLCFSRLFCFGGG
jgi:hypothetical protein